MKKLSYYFLIVVGFLFIGIANVDAVVEISSATELGNALSGSTVSGTTVKLTKNVDLAKNVISIKSGTYTLDLNGFKITSTDYDTIEIKAGDLTVNDSSVKKTGVIQVTNNGTDSDSKAAIASYGGKLTINGGSFISTKGRGIYLSTSSGDNTVVINGGVMSGTVGISVVLGSSKALNLTINNATAIGNWSMYIGMSGSDTKSPNSKISIKGGTYTSLAYGLYVNNYAIPYVKISGGYFAGTKYGGIYTLKKSDTVTNSYTLSSLLEEGYKYTIDTFTDKTVDNTVYSCTATTVSVKKESKITIKDDIKNGTIKAGKATALADEEVTLTVTPESGYKLKSVSVVDKDGKNPVEVKDNKFKMPGYDVYISAEFEVDYSFSAESKNQIYTINKDESLVFKLNVSSTLFSNGGKVYIDNKLVSSSKYTVSTSGNTIITLSSDYLNMLDIGKHTIKVVFNTGGSASESFEVVAYSDGKTISAPNTGSVLSFFEIFAGIALVGAGGFAIYRKYKKDQKLD